ncbi:SDR family NAD(P)-dependent oxidoreductase [Phenylobacterium sp.]|uniref:SDR family NAD(P)-dependent oxidoreductase n=1 Tax=Phenylobacterium sp. TaxID=1871053 RepID=UPI0025D94D0C|nr:SDR family NAD(P)-dependent oxidoreductase [Phenylobacterium sp.]MBX3485795.1 SDR family oxidoreductase [Phenylobacterium sp.]
MGLPVTPPNLSSDLTGQVALVTGASSGLGHRFAEVLAACGARVAVAARRTDRLHDLAARIREAGGEAEPFALDVSAVDDIAPVVDAIEDRLGRVSILVNNAGVVDAQHATRLTREKTDQVFDTNLRGPFALSCEVARRLIAAGAPGRIVNIASMTAFDYWGGGAALYALTKGAVVRMTEVLAVEWSRFDINVNAIAPGVVASEMTDGMLARMGPDALPPFPRGRMGAPEDLDSTLVYLVSPASSFVTGTVIKADDGQNHR